MSKRSVKKRGAATPAKTAALGLGISFALIVLLAALGALLISKGVFPERGAGIVAAAAVFLAALVGPMPLLRATGKRPLPAAYLHMGLLLIVLAIAKLIFWPGASYGNWASFAAAPVGATICGLLQAQHGKRRR